MNSSSIKQHAAAAYKSRPSLGGRHRFLATAREMIFLLRVAQRTAAKERLAGPLVPLRGVIAAADPGAVQRSGDA
jgi:hypothetical protein